MAPVWVALILSASQPLSAYAEACGGNPGGLCRVDGPKTEVDTGAWMANMTADRHSTQQKLHWAAVPKAYDNRALVWSRAAYIAPQVHPFDRFLFNRSANAWSVQHFLQDLNSRYGGIDALSLWPTYPNLGADDRNQYDLYRALPGGLAGLTKVTSQLLSSNVSTLWAYLFWDTGTRREDHKDERVVAELLKQTGARGINGDSLPFVPKSFWDESVSVSWPIAVQAEGGTRDEALPWSTIGWGYWGRQSNPGDAAGYHWTYDTVPLVDRFKWVTDGQYLTQICDRYAKNKTDMVQLSWFNGVGLVAWENVWGAFNGITDRDGEHIRRVSSMLRFFGPAYLQSNQWRPFANVTLEYAVYASAFEASDSSTLYAIVNRIGTNRPAGPQLALPMSAANDRFVDCYHGVELKPRIANGQTTLEFLLEGGGVGCVLQLPRSTPPPTGLDGFIRTMGAMTKRNLASFDATWAILKQTMTPIPLTKRLDNAPLGMVRVPRTANFSFACANVMIENDAAVGGGFQYPWSAEPKMKQKQTLDLGPFFIDRYPVTCTQYSAYLESSGYWPEDAYNFLKNLNGSRHCPASMSKKPATYVSHEEARQFCAYYGKRLPHSYEWQLAAQGTDGRTYPWGSTKDQTKFPTVVKGRIKLADVDAFAPHDASPFGVSALVGHVWQWTDEFCDPHTCRSSVRGGSNYEPLTSGQHYYFKQALELNKEQKYLTMSDSYDRTGTFSFRCVVDAA
jgi:iron(II)-dependent oxidoreductase